MATYILMTKLAPVGRTAKGLLGRREAGKEWKKAVQRLCPDIKWIAHYALLGPYDFMDVYEAPDDKAAFQVSLLSRHHGAASAESWPAMAYEGYLSVAEEVEREE